MSSKYEWKEYVVEIVEEVSDTEVRIKSVLDDGKLDWQGWKVKTCVVLKSSLKEIIEKPVVHINKFPAAHNAVPASVIKTKFNLPDFMMIRPGPKDHAVPLKEGTKYDRDWLLSAINDNGVFVK